MVFIWRKGRAVRYIDADALKTFIRNQYFQCDMPEEWGNGVMWATSQINHYCNKVAPSIDIEPKRGEWIDRSDGGRILNPWWETYECSKCGQYGARIWHFCPNCGARMKGADDE